MKRFFAAVFTVTTLVLASPASAQNAREPEISQLGECGVFVRTDPWCNEAVEIDTRQLQSLQLFVINLAPPAQEEWRRRHQERRRGITYTLTNAEGQQERTGRPVIPAVFRVFLYPPAGTQSQEEAFLAQAVVREDGSSLAVLLPSEGNFTGWSAFILATEGDRGLTTSGQVIRLGGRHRHDGNFTLDIARLPVSLVPAETLRVTRGDGSQVIETLETVFSDHAVVRDRDGSTRVYSGLPGTFTPLSEDGTTVATMFTNCRRADQRLIERGDLRFDTTTVAGLVAGPVGLIRPAIMIFRNIRALAGGSCRR